jgi:hypothetical protein
MLRRAFYASSEKRHRVTLGLGATKPNEVAAAAGALTDAERADCVVADQVERAAPKNTRIGICYDSVLAPLPEVARHIEASASARTHRVDPYRGSLERTLFASVAAGGIELVAPRVTAIDAKFRVPRCGMLPFLFRWQRKSRPRQRQERRASCQFTFTTGWSSESEY